MTAILLNGSPVTVPLPLPQILAQPAPDGVLLAPGLRGSNGSNGGPVPAGGTPGEYVSPDGGGGYEWIARPVARDELVVSALDYGAAGDDTTDDTSAVQAAITAGASFGLTTDLLGKTYKTTNTLTLAAGAKLTNGTIRCTGTAKKILNVTGDNVKLRDLSVVGRHTSTTYSVSEFGIYAQGPSAASMIHGLLLERVSVEKVGDWGVVLKWVDGFKILQADIGQIGYTGIGTLSALNGLIDGCRVDDVLGAGSGDAYGISISRSAEVASFVTAPKCENITVSNCFVSNVPWEGIDTHGGERISIVDNIVVGCKNGVSVVGDDAEGQVATYATKQFVVKGNIIDSLLTNGSAGPGIQVAGAEGASAGVVALDYATGIVVGNTIRNHGNQADNISGAMYFRNTEGLGIYGNHIESPSPTAICLYYDNRGFSIVGNAVSDAWSNTTTLASAINVRSSNNIGVVDNNTLRTTGAKAGATNLNGFGIYADSTTGTDINFGTNHFDIAALPVSAAAPGIKGTFHAPVVTKDKILAKNGTATSPSYGFSNDANMGFYLAASDQIGVTVGATLRMRFLTTAQLLTDGYNLSLGTSTGTMVGVGATQKLGFWGATPVVKPTAVADATDAASAITQLNALLARMRTVGLITT